MLMSKPRLCSLLDLPTELLVEIISYHPYPFTFLSPLLRQEHGAQERHDRRQVLRSLSQTCVVLRTIFLPLLWERFEASQASLQEIHTNEAVASLLFPYIKSVHISMKTWGLEDMEAVFLFVQFIRALPNLVGLQIYQASYECVPVLSYAFADIMLPNITALCVPDWLDGIFPAFPNLTTLACPCIYTHSTALAPAKQFFPRLEAITGLRLSRNLIEAVLQDFPNLRAITVTSTIPLQPKKAQSHSDPMHERCTADPDDLALLSSFKNLSELSLIHDETVMAEAVVLPLDVLLQRGADVLRASKNPGRKVLRVWSFDMYRGYEVEPRVIPVRAL
ncbi:hypothetical protein DFH07DRAFT_578404 [Mycena maculata]|uniref:F-box domain-containing protein n=1 Tax=Mycena maculata TaxID=230809 RepID=A0AAD7INE7_9AGAR|nr:hypothetical protein DFH07DRAFT_578404 [Mycena maculata]